ncbi:MAG: hypothetical protein O6705_04615, partial [Actinobacteria bacterium]|nr:hypothetical protein [Actinomycetota bacterium]
MTFTFINESDTTGVGFVVWTVPDGTTAAEINEKGIFEATGTRQGNTAPYEFWEAKFPPTQLDTEYQVTVTLDRAGLYSVNCFVDIGTPVNTHRNDHHRGRITACNSISASAYRHICATWDGPGWGRMLPNVRGTSRSLVI